MIGYHRPHPKKTISIRHPKPELAQLYETDLPTDQERPRFRSECVNGPRPCVFVACRHHLFIDVNSAGGIVLNFPGKELEDLTDTCALDVAERGDHTLEEVGEYLNLTRERIRQIETHAMWRFPEELFEYLLRSCDD